MRLPKDILFGTYNKPRIFLCETDKSRICQLETMETNAALKFNTYSELSFDVARKFHDTLTGNVEVNPFYDKIEAVRLIELEGFGYFELQGPELISDGINEKKSCTAYSLEYTLSQKYLEDFNINMGTVTSLEVINASSEKNIIPITLYNPSRPELSLLHLVLSEVYGWKIGHVDASLQTLSRQFEVDRASVYDFLMNEVCQKFNCYIVFDTITNTINIYAESLTAKFIGDGATNAFVITPPFSQIGTVSVNGYKTTRWEYNALTGVLKLEDVPESDARIEVVDGALSEWATDVFITFDNLSQEININYDADTIKTRLSVTYGDDYDIREVNLGLPYLTDLSYFYTVDWMGQDLYDAYTKYLQKSNSCQVDYANNSQEILKINDCIAYEENRLSLEYSLTLSVNAQTVGTYYIRQENLDGTHYYSEVSLPAEYRAGVDYYSNVTTNLNEDKVSALYGVLKKYFYACFHNDNEGVLESIDDLNELSDSFKFMQTYTIAYLSSRLKSATSNNDRDAAIYNFLNEMWNEIGRTPLVELYLKPYKTIQDTNIKAGWSNKDSDNYGYYYPVVLFVNSIELDIAEIDEIIADYKQQRSVFEQANQAISNSLIMKNNFTNNQLIRLSPFIREDELQLDDIVETSQDNLSSSFKIKQDAMESGRIELQKLCQPQLQFTMSMANIYALPEFEPIIDQFQLGKVIRVCLRPDYIKQSRLLQVNINFDDFTDFSCEFGELTSLRTQSDIHADLLSQAISAGKSVATNSSYWTKGSDVATSTDLKIQQGLLDATTQIKAIDGTQGVVIDKYGIRMQEVDPNTGEVAPEQGWITNNKFLYTDDGFKTTKSVFGKYTYDNQSYYGILAEALVGNLLIGSQIKLENVDSSMTFDNNGLSVYNDTNSFVVNPYSDTLLRLADSSQDILWVDDKGALHIRGDGEGLDISANSSITGMQSSIEQTDSQIVSTVSALAKYDTTQEDGTPYDITLYGLGSAKNSQYEASDYKDQYYLNQSNGVLYKSTGRVWAIETSLPLITDNLNSRISQTESEISLKVSAGEVISAINLSTEEIKISGSKLTFEGLVTANNYFQILEDGSIKAVNADLSGDITTNNLSATGGDIAGWDITDHSIQKTVEKSDGTTSTTGLQIPDRGKWAIAVGAPRSDDWSDAPFRIDHDGHFYATQADISGKISADDGDIAGWDITDHCFMKTNGGLTTGLQPPGSGKWGLAIGAPSSNDWSGAPFRVDHEGNMYAASGKIGDWEIVKKYNASSNTYSHYLGSHGSVANAIFLSHDGYAANVNGEEKQCLMYAKGQFAVDTGGILYARGANISGTITATSGSFSRDVTIGGRSIANWITEGGYIKEIAADTGNIGGWYIDGQSLKGTDSNSYVVWLEPYGVYAQAPGDTVEGPARWYDLCVFGVGSDATLKNNIHAIEDKYDVFFDNLTPSTFNYKPEFKPNGYEKTHFGFIAQDILKNQNALGLNDLNIVYGNDYYRVIKDEFIALNTWQIQKLKKRVAELEAKLEQKEI